ncbi:hypothetical protein [Streptoalloteichus hindustanus]|uniref:hypothetical protein n=1 Tax=Streptoalloteichus hindustanus TaxID=2017 RepID=UPI000937311E|nr:hypothetical protein [Streptoalloteichus hindustanus]
MAGIVAGTALGVAIVVGAVFGTLQWLPLPESQEHKLERLLGKVTVAGYRQTGKHLGDDEHGIRSIEGYYVGLPSDTPLDEMVSAEGMIPPKDYPVPGFSHSAEKDADGNLHDAISRIEECLVTATKYAPNRKPGSDPGLSGSEWEQVRSGKLVLFQVFIMCDFRW